MKISIRFKLVIVLIVIVLLGAAGCAGSDAATSPPEISSPVVPTTAPTIPPTPVPTEIPASTAVPTPAPTEITDAGGSCLVGRWIITDMSPYFQSAFEGTTITYEGSTGNAWYQFNREGSFLLEAIEFTQFASVKIGMNEISMEVVLDGVAFASYRVEGNKVIFNDQRTSGLVFEAEIFGERTDLQAGLLGDEASGEVAYLYECVGSNELHLTPPLEGYEVFPILLERYE